MKTINQEKDQMEIKIKNERDENEYISNVNNLTKDIHNEEIVDIKLPIKVKYGNDIRFIFFKKNGSFKDFKSLISKTFNLNNIKLKYLDERDIITLFSIDDFNHFMKNPNQKVFVSSTNLNQTKELEDYLKFHKEVIDKMVKNNKVTEAKFDHLYSNYAGLFMIIMAIYIIKFIIACFK